MEMSTYISCWCTITWMLYYFWFSKFLALNHYQDIYICEQVEMIHILMGYKYWTSRCCMQYFIIMIMKNDTELSKTSTARRMHWDQWVVPTENYKLGSVMSWIYRWNRHGTYRNRLIKIVRISIYYMHGVGLAQNVTSQYSTTSLHHNSSTNQ